MLVLFIFLIIILMVWNAIENHRITVSDYELTEASLPEAFHGKKILYLADYHNTPYPKYNEKLKKQIEKCCPDYIFIGGDFLSKRDSSFAYAMDLLSFLAKRYPVYFSNGNHETKMKNHPEKYHSLYQDFRKLTNGLSITFLNNSQCRLYAETEKGKQSIVLHGLELDEKYFDRKTKVSLEKEKINKYLGKCSPKEYHILLAHSPDYFEAYEQWGANLIFSGHNHGGMARIPGIGGVLSTQAKLFPKYTKGCYRKNQSKMIVSAGLGSHTIKIRFFNPPDLVMVTLYSAKNGCEE